MWSRYQEVQLLQGLNALNDRDSSRALLDQVQTNSPAFSWRSRSMNRSYSHKRSMSLATWTFFLRFEQQLFWIFNHIFNVFEERHGLTAIDDAVVV
ncbi:hypothetical protein EVJ30_07645 [Exiguobacterium sp. SH5S13]|nr:hypothetical protein EVJ30_07645 [Exiguobacterium sp. SH5S13]